LAYEVWHAAPFLVLERAYLPYISPKTAVAGSIA